jgi:hypothetical protein
LEKLFWRRKNPLEKIIKVADDFKSCSLLSSLTFEFFLWKYFLARFGVVGEFEST